ncbi:MAG: Fic family protein [Vampirovibrionales bacterium]|nr:Fic family protein [Vampirovibrionales bacterium]
MNTDSRITDCEALKAEIDSYRPLDEYTLNQLKAYYRVGLTYASNALEGNTLTETETKVVLEDGITIGGKPMKDHLEAIGHAKAYDLLYDLIQNPSVTEADLLALHRLVVEGIDGTKPGQYRSKPVIITGTAYVPPQPADVPGQMQTFIEDKLPNWIKAEHPIHTAALAHLELVTIHPFLDGNGRTARLLMNLLLLKTGYPITIIPPVLRSDYMACLRSFQESQDNTPFLNFISNVVVESSKDMLRLLKHLQPR